MKNMIKFLLFIVYLIAIFYINQPMVLLALLVVNFFIMFAMKLDVKIAIQRLLVLMPFVIFTVLINCIFSSIFNGVLIGIRLVLAYIVTYLFANSTTTVELASTIGKLLSPLKIFKIKVDEIELIISIAISTLPIISSELEQKVNSIKSKAFRLKWNSMTVLLKPMMISILRRTNEMEDALISKGGDF